SEDGGQKSEVSGDKGIDTGGASKGELVRAGTSGCEFKSEDGSRKTESGGLKTEGPRPSCRAGGANGKGDRVTEVGGQRTEVGGAKGKGDRPACGTELQTKRAADGSGGVGESGNDVNVELPTKAATEGGAPLDRVNEELQTGRAADGSPILKPVGKLKAENESNHLKEAT
ncbi:MAG: hypothetical protein JWQ71_3493, partial [Pedosphaera sp.]|nr:hypothetical protein [Pedosphaera sp.]